MVLNLGPLDWESNSFTTRPLEEATVANVNWIKIKSVKPRKVRKYFINPKIQNEDFS